MGPAFVGFMIGSVVGAAAGMVVAFSVACKNRFEMSGRKSPRIVVGQSWQGTSPIIPPNRAIPSRQSPG
jgi:Ca2+/H+ antiporter